MNPPKKGRSLAEVIASIEDEDVALPTPSAEPEASAQPSAVAAPAIVPINILVTPEDRRRLRQLSLDTGLSLQKLGHEAWNMLLNKRGLPPLTTVSANVPSGRNRRQKG